MARLGELRGLRAAITGASSGIGEALALRLAREGARVALVARRQAELERVAAAVREAGGEALVLPCDVSDRAAVEAAAERLRRAWGPPELLVNNAGYGGHHLFLEWDVADIERMMRVNYLGSVYWTKALLPDLVAAGRGWIVMMASVAGHLATPDESAYVATKFALVGLSEALSIEVEDAGVHVLCVCPGLIRTPFFGAEALERLPAAAQRHWVEPEVLVEQILAALRAGRRRLTYPRALAGAYVLRELLPGFFRWGVRRSVWPALRERAAAAVRGARRGV